MKLNFVITVLVVSMLLSFEISSAKSEGPTEFAILNGNLKNISINHLIVSNKLNHSTLYGVSSSKTPIVG